MYMNLRNKMCKELEAMEEKYRSGAEMSEGDLRKIDLLAHSLKSLSTYIAMKEAEDYREEQNMSRGYGYAPNYDRYPTNNYENNSYGGQDRRMMYPDGRRW